jgi:phosphatidate phosphatase APP1
MASIEIAFAKLKATFNNTEYFFESDEDGYFEFSLPLKTRLPQEELWHYPLIELMESSVKFNKPLIKRAHVMTPPATAQFGVISDIDDTVLPTDAGSIFKMAFNTFIKNHFTRFPFRGVPSFYNALQKGISGENFNPVFYVSSSPWNLYDLLSDFFKVNNIPAGPLLLKDYGFTHKKIFTESHLGHKTKMIRNILNTYPQLPFILIGDSGQKDPEIYSQIVNEFPGRINSVYIRDVSDEKRDPVVRHFSETLKGKTDFLLCNTTLEAATHAFSNKYISEAGWQIVKTEIELEAGRDV